MKNKSILTLSNSQLQAYDHSPIRNIHTKRILNGITSIEIGHTSTEEVIKMCIDKLTFVSSPSTRLYVNSLDKALDSLEGDETYKVIHLECKGKDRLYKQAVLVKYANPNGRYDETIIRIEYISIDRNNQDVRAPVRFELSPQHFSEQELTGIIHWLAGKQRIGNRIYKILEKAWVTRIDVAFDVYSALMRNYFMSLMGARTGKVVKSNDDMLSMSLGGIDSDIFCSVYEKAELIKKKISEMTFLCRLMSLNYSLA